ncbi:uncharacterized protein LOC132196633 [Neocloeon triangulifer]|uniref:uncharacterized protein LOC132196633 n=1 Tax=Neocloeon triangulifer TaxID=2078957 RepID=UPI00286FA929|nr:uncharacterized protein LOC132196633 [Neocloeon triangulifer]
MHSKKILIAFCVLAVVAIAKAQGLAEEDMDDTQHEGDGRYARAAYHHEGGSGGGGGGSGGSGGGSPNGGHDDEVEYGAHTGEKGAFEWHAHYPVGHH